MKSGLKLVFSYLTEHKKTAFLFTVYTGIHMIAYFLYHLPFEPFFYAFLLFITVLLLCVVYDITKYYSRHNHLRALKKNIHIAVEELPVPKGMIEKDYQELMDCIHRDRKQIISEADSRFSGLTEYYTMWVHQIKTPISAMRLLLQSEESNSMEDLLTELFKIEQYVEMVLQYIRLDSSSSDFVFKQYKLDTIIRSAVKKYAKLFIGKKISLQFQQTAYTVLTDEKWLAFVIEQLLSNALKYTHTGSISIYMEKEGLLVIQDTGIGIAAEDLPRIFEQGYTGYNGRLYQKSTGIGLSLCQKMIQKLSHQIAIESEIGIGTKVLLNLTRM